MLHQLVLGHVQRQRLPLRGPGERRRRDGGGGRHFPTLVIANLVVADLVVATTSVATTHGHDEGRRGWCMVGAWAGGTGSTTMGSNAVLVNGTSSGWRGGRGGERPGGNQKVGMLMD